ncbi:MAG: hypothetical protein J6R77_07815 [Clostridia bacterium]|nr:hypothetical protein [Clostridia bacterium]
MKNILKLITLTVALITLLTAFTLPAAAMDFDAFFSDPQGFVNQQQEEAQRQHEEAVAEAGRQQEEAQRQQEEINQMQNEIWGQVQEGLAEYEQMSDRIQDMHSGFEIGSVFIILLVVLLIGLLIAEIVYILVTAPKCGMSRWWALVPVFSNLLGLIVFILVRSARKQTASGHTIQCPRCNGIHPVGTPVCPICGTAL